MSAKLYKVMGIVQGVFFRKSTEEFVHANAKNLKGYVQNLSDGSVEVYAVGSDDELTKLEGFLNKGPESARVDKVIISEETLEQEYKDFSIKR